MIMILYDKYYQFKIIVNICSCRRGTLVRGPPKNSLWHLYKTVQFLTLCIEVNKVRHEWPGHLPICRWNEVKCLHNEFIGMGKEHIQLQWVYHLPQITSSDCCGWWCLPISLSGDVSLGLSVQWARRHQRSISRWAIAVRWPNFAGVSLEAPRVDVSPLLYDDCKDDSARIQSSISWGNTPFDKGQMNLLWLWTEEVNGTCYRFFVVFFLESCHSVDSKLGSTSYDVHVVCPSKNSWGSVSRYKVIRVDIWMSQGQLWYHAWLITS